MTTYWVENKHANDWAWWSANFHGTTETLLSESQYERARNVGPGHILFHHMLGVHRWFGYSVVLKHAERIRVPQGKGEITYPYSIRIKPQVSLTKPEEFFLTQSLPGLSHQSWDHESYVRVKPEDAALIKKAIDEAQAATGVGVATFLKKLKVLRTMRFLIITLFACAISQSALASPLPPPEKTDRCAVCGMFVAPFPAWVAGFELKDGRRYYFDGPKDLFTCLLDLPSCLPGVTEEQVAEVSVTEYYSTRLLPAAEIVFVTGSDVLGPMGKELVPILDREAAETFRRDHAGEKLLRFDGRQLVELVTQP